MSRNSLIRVPVKFDNHEDLARFLQALVEKLDVVLGNRADTPFATVEALAALEADTESAVGELSSGTSTTLAGLAERTTALENLLEQPVVVDISITPITASVSYIQAEAQQVADDVVALGDKVNAILATLRSAKIISS